MFRLPSTSFTAFFGSLGLGGRCILGAVCLHLRGLWYQRILPWRSWWPVRAVSDFSVALSLEIGPLRCPFRWAAPGTLGVTLTIVYLSVHSLFSFGLVISRPERSYAHLV